MPLKVFRFALVVSTVLLITAIGFAFLACPEIGSAYLRASQTEGLDLPLLTDQVSVPLLRIAPEDAHRRPVTEAWVASVWGLMLLTPLGIATWSIRASTLEDAMARWIAGYAVYLPVLALIALVVLLGLALPLACM